MTDHSVSLSYTFPDAETARVVERSVGVEAGDIADDRARATVSRSDEVLEVRIEATDLVALRAGTNTWSRLVAVAERVA